MIPAINIQNSRFSNPPKYELTFLQFQSVEIMAMPATKPATAGIKVYLVATANPRHNPLNSRCPPFFFD